MKHLTHCLMSGGVSRWRRASDVPVSPTGSQETQCGHPEGKECAQNGHHGIFRYFNALIIAPCCSNLVANLVITLINNMP